MDVISRTMLSISSSLQASCYCPTPFSSSTKQQPNVQLRTMLKWAPIRVRAVSNTSASIMYCDSSGPSRTLYDVLSVLPSAEIGEVKKAYRDKVRVCHPDVCPPHETQESCKMFLLVQEAYETLVDPMLRADYDYNLDIGINSPIMASEGKNERAGKQQWEDQVQSLMRRSNTKRETWCGRMRCNREDAGAH